MPFYEYQCKNCGHDLEAMQKISEPPLKKCPHCGKQQLQRLMSAPVFRLKGAGWYETDFKSDQDDKRNLADRPEPEAAKEEKKEGKDAVETAAKDAKPAEKAAADTKPEKAADKTAPPAAKKRAPAKIAKRGAAARVKHKKPVKASVAKAKRRR